MVKLISLFILFFVASAYCLPVSENDIDEDLNDYAIDTIPYMGPEAYGGPMKKNGDAVRTWSEASLMNPEEKSGYGEGDIMLPPSISSRNGISDQYYRWKNGEIPYVIEGNFNNQQLHVIKEAMDDYHRQTCIRFVPYKGQQDYVAIQSNQEGCYSYLGRIGGRQEVNLEAPGCVTKKGTVLHELMHTVGFLHEQSRPDRDNYITINYNNVRPGLSSEFNKADRETNDFGVPYDYHSVMHYGAHAFSKNSQQTIIPKNSGVIIGQRNQLSQGDITKINRMYKCVETNLKPKPVPSKPSNTRRIWKNLKNNNYGTRRPNKQCYRIFYYIVCFDF